MRHVLPGLFLLTLPTLLLPLVPGARAADPAPATPQHHPAPAHPAANAPAHAPAAKAHPSTVHPVHGTAPPYHGSRPAHPGAAHPGPAHPGPAKPTPPAPVPVPEAAPVPAVPDKGSNTGLPLPRWSALRTEEVNLRTGPGTRYPIDWVYKRRDLPVKVEREFDVWRLVALPDGTRGWVSGATLVTHRTFSVNDAATAPARAMRAAAGEDAAVVARLKPGVIGRIRACDAGAAWCQVQVGEYRGWLRRDAFWGTDPGEAVQ
ncbi:MAG: SH3 domain-containing protein [Janthinobacterium lividum]